MRKIGRRLCLPIVLILGIACSPSGRRRDMLIIGVGGSLNLGNHNPVMIQRNANVWESLTELDDFFIARPSLAESWRVSPDGKTWTFRLRKGVLFHDGTVLTAAAAVWNVQRMKNHPEFDYYGTFLHLISADALDETAFRLVFSRPVVDLPNRIGHYFAGIFSPSAFDETGKIIKPVASGPYIFKESRIGRYDRVSAFDGYHGRKPYFHAVEFRIIPDPIVRVMSLLRGDIDMIAHHGGVPASLKDLLEGRPDIVVRSQDVAITHYLLFNCAREPFSVKALRTAFAGRIDREELVNLILRGGGIPAHDFFIGRAMRWDKHRFPMKAENMNFSRTSLKTLKKHRLKFLLNQGDAQSWGYKHVADYLADIFSQMGLTIDIDVREGGAWSKAVEKGDFDLTLYPLSMPLGTPELLIRRLVFSEGMKVRGIGNSTHYRSVEIDKLFLEAMNAPDAKIQERQFNMLLDMIRDETPIIPLFHEKYYYAFRKGLSGVKMDPFLKLDLSCLYDHGRRP